MASNEIVLVSSAGVKLPVAMVALGDGTYAVPVSGGAGGGGGDASAANQVTGNASLAAINTKTPALGVAASAAASPVVIASDQAAIPVAAAVAAATGSITTQNLVPAGAATAGSAVEITLNGANTLGIQVAGTYTGALSLQVTLDGTNWITVGGTPLINLNTGGYLASITSALASIFQADVGGAVKARITGLAAVTGTAVVTLRGTQSSALVALDAALPTGTNTIGAVNIAAAQTLATVTAVTTLSNGQAAHSAASTGSPMRVAGRVNTAIDSTLVAGDVSDVFMTTGGAMIGKPYAVPELDWTYAAATAGIVNSTTAVTMKAAAAAGVRNYITSIDISTDGALGAATEVAIRDGAAGTVLWRMKIGAGGLQGGRTINFPTPLKGTAATLLEVVTLTASVTGAVYINAQGYTAP